MRSFTACTTFSPPMNRLKIKGKRTNELTSKEKKKSRFLESDGGNCEEISAKI